MDGEHISGDGGVIVTGVVIAQLVLAVAAVLDHCVLRFRERAEELAQSLCIEAGKPIKDARGEVTRLIDTFRIAAEECTRLLSLIHI